jgi:hypothetical protein
MGSVYQQVLPLSQMSEMMSLCHPYLGQMHATDTVHLFQQQPEIKLATVNTKSCSIKVMKRIQFSSFHI